MKKIKRAFSLILVLFTVFGMVACQDKNNTDDTSDVINTDASTEKTEVEKYQERTVGSVKLCDDSAIDPLQITNKVSAGGAFTVAPDAYVTSFTVRGPSWSNKSGYMKFALYKWNENYAKSLEGEPIFAKNAYDFIDNQTFTFRFDGELVGEGRYAYVFRDGSDDQIGVFLSKVNTKGSMDGVITDVKAYRGNFEDGMSPMVHLTYSKKTESKDENSENLSDTILTKPTVGKAHVILLMGQGNITGYANNSLLYDSLNKTTDGVKKYRSYQNGFKNVLIRYSMEEKQNTSGDKFVPVKLGQGFLNDKFGPEVGLAAYLSEAYPDETFYIIKEGNSGPGKPYMSSCLYNDWKAGDGPLFIQMCRKIKNIIADMKKDGLDPEIFAMCWFMGEHDAYHWDYAQKYGENERKFFEEFSQMMRSMSAPGGITMINTAVSEKSYWTYSDVVNEHKKWNSEHCANMLYITKSMTANTLSETDDYWHYDSLPMIDIGTDFGKAVARVFENKYAE